jgi:hypothetical protein
MGLYVQKAISRPIRTNFAFGSNWGRSVSSCRLRCERKNSPHLSTLSPYRPLPRDSSTSVLTILFHRSQFPGARCHGSRSCSAASARLNSTSSHD